MTKPSLAVQTPEGRMYVHPVTGEAVYSVTTIIGNGVPKPELVEYSAGQVAKYAVENWSYLSELSLEDRRDALKASHEIERNIAADKGDEVHTLVEHYREGDPLEDPFLKQWQNFLDVSGWTITHREVTLWNKDYEYAGTADFIAEDPTGVAILGDIKTGKSIYPEAGLQVEALSRCPTILHEDGFEERAPYIDYCAVLHLRPRSWKLTLIDDDYISAINWSAFLAAKEISEWRRMHPSMTLGTRTMNKDNWSSIDY